MTYAIGMFLLTLNAQPVNVQPAMNVVAVDRLHPCRTGDVPRYETIVGRDGRRIDNCFEPHESIELLRTAMDLASRRSWRERIRITIRP